MTPTLAQTSFRRFQFKYICILSGLFCVSSLTFGQFADLGNGNYKNSIWWVNWSGFIVQNQTTRVVTTNTGLQLSFHFTNLSGVTPYPSVMKTWAGSMLPIMYDFSNPGIKPALLTSTTTQNTIFTVTVEGFRNGIPVPFSLVISDAEASSTKEQIRVKTSGSNFQTIEFYRNSTQTTNPFIGCNTNSGYFTETQDESVWPIMKGQCPLILTESDGSPLQIDVSLDRTVYGASAIAFGVLEGVDRGDLPASYGYAQHRLKYSSSNTCNYNPPFPTLIQNENLGIGSVIGDADPIENSDDNAVGVDEDAISIFPDYDNSGTYSLVVPVANKSGNNAYLSAWFDHNQDGVFQSSEKMTAVIPNNAISATINWTGLPVIPVTAANFAFRFRITRDLAASGNPTGFAPDGEVEDYWIPLNILVSDSVIINDYASALQFDPCNNELSVDNASNFQPGDTVVLMQMKGAVIDSSNSSAFGTITQYNNAGNYEFNIVKSKAGNTLTLLNVLKRNYDIPNGKVQLIRVPYFDHFDSSKVVTCLPWDGSKGGVLILNVKNDINLKADIDVSGKGFRHGGRLQDSRVTANATGYFYNAASNNGGEKGEGVYATDILRKYGRGAQANGGGGGNAHNAGGGGGGNGGAGGTGGDQYEPLKTIMDQNGGKGGKELLTNPVVNKLFLGGAGGMGQANDLEEFSAGNGGGIAIMIANQLNSNGFQIKANGQDGEQAPNPTLCKDGMPGGGAGGTILLDIPNITTATSIAAKGGNGADQIAMAYNGRFGGGGGGGGGVVATTQGVLSPLFSVDVSGGINGVCVAYGNDAWGATPGNGGKIIPVFPLMKANQQFIRNIDSVRITTQLQNCNEMTVSGIPYVQNFPVATWLWDFGDGNSSNVQNPIHTYSNEGSYNIKLIISDMNGCRDSISTQVIAYSTQISLSNDTSICEKNTVQFTAWGGNTYQWTPAATLNDPNIANPVATPLATTKYFVKVTKAAGCEITDSVLVTVNNLPNIIKSPDTTICIGTSASLLVSGGAQYTWSPAATLNNPGISNPMASPIQTTNYKVLVTSSEGCTKEDSIKVDLFPEQKIQAVADPLVCMHTSVNLSATGGNSFIWSPQNMVVDPASGNTTSVPLSASTLFYLTIKDVNSCTYQDSVEIKVKPEKVFSISADTTVCMNSNVVVAASGGDQYQWLLPAGISDPGNASVNWPSTGNTTFSVVVSENECGQKDTLFTTVSTLPLPQVTAQSSNDISCAVPFAKLSAVGNGRTFEWSPATGLSDPHINNPVATPKTNTVYIVTVTDGNGCRNTDSVLINVKFTDKVFAGMPNAFTPNGDGINDCFGLRPFGQVKNLDFRIYNRFGQLVFQANNSNDCWNGTFKGVPQDAGVFVFTVTGSTECQQINYKGTVTLIR